MNRCLRSFSLAAVLAAPVFAADPIFTDPVGFVKLGDVTGGGTPAVAANRDVFLTIPLDRELEYSGTIASSTANTITVNGSPSWSANQWTPGPQEPYSAIISSGPENGVRALITSHTSDTLTVTVTTPGDLSSISIGDSIQIRKCWTLKSFGDGFNLPDGTQILVWDENLTDINQVSSDSYVFGGGNWFNNRDFSDGNNVMLYPGETFVLRSGGTPVETLTLFGDVPTSASRVALAKDNPGAEDMFLGLMRPVPSLVSDLSIPVSDGDQLLLYDPKLGGINTPASNSYVYGGGFWFDNTDFSDVTGTLTLQPGEGFVLRRASTSPASEEWIEPAP